MDTKACNSISSAPLNQVLVLAHGRKTQSSLPRHFAYTLTIQQKPGGKSPTLCERDIVFLFAHRRCTQVNGCYVVLWSPYLYTIQYKFHADATRKPYC